MNNAFCGEPPIEANYSENPEPDGNNPEEQDDLLWADVGDRLNLTVRQMRSLRGDFGDLLGLEDRRGVPEHLIPAIAFISKERQSGTSDSKIRVYLEHAKTRKTWPEEVLARMETASAAAIPKPVEAADNLHTVTSLLLKSASMTAEDEDLAVPATTNNETSEASYREMLLDLRREMRAHIAAQRADLLRLDQVVRKLSLEVRDMRYALLIAFTRKDRKRGQKGISNLLLG